MEKEAPVDVLGKPVIGCSSAVTPPLPITVPTVATSVSLRSCDLGTQCTTNTLVILQLWGSARLRACVGTEEEGDSREKLPRTSICVLAPHRPVFWRCHHITLAPQLGCCCQAEDNGVVTLLIDGMAMMAGNMVGYYYDLIVVSARLRNHTDFSVKFTHHPDSGNSSWSNVRIILSYV